MLSSLNFSRRALGHISLVTITEATRYAKVKIDQMTIIKNKVPITPFSSYVEHFAWKVLAQGFKTNVVSEVAFGLDHGKKDIAIASNMGVIIFSFYLFIYLHYTHQLDLII